MTLGAFVRPLHTDALRYHGGAFLQLLAAVLLVPAAAAVGFAEWQEAALLTAAAAVYAAAGALARHGEPPELELREAMALSALAYLAAAAAGSVAFLGVAGPVDAFFESMSGFTTTGLTVMDVEQLPRSLLLLRALSQWVGGGGVVVLSLVVLAGPGSSAMRLYTAELGGRNLLGSAAATGRVVAASYVALTATGYVALLAAGTGAYDGLLHALALLSTGGFSPYADSIGAYDSRAVNGVTMAFMAVGAISFPLYYLAWREGWRRLAGDAQVLALVVLGGLAAVGLVAFDGWDAPMASAFHAISALTTTGFVVGDARDWSDGGRLLVVGLMGIGGSVGSTAGGLKLLRLLILLRLLGWTVRRVLLPREAKIPLKIQHAPVGEDEVRQAFALVAAYGLLLFLSALALTAAGAGLEDAVFDAASALGTVGLSVGVVGPDLAAWAKLVLAFDMWAGRLEILALLVLLHPYNWHR